MAYPLKSKQQKCKVFQAHVSQPTVSCHKEPAILEGLSLFIAISFNPKRHVFLIALNLYSVLRHPAINIHQNRIHGHVSQPFVR